MKLTKLFISDLQYQSDLEIFINKKTNEKNSNLEIIKLLIDSNPSISFNSSRACPAQNAILHNKLIILKLMCEAFDAKKIPHLALAKYAAERGKVDCVKYLISCDYPESKNWIAELRSIACNKGQIELAKYFFQTFELGKGISNIEFYRLFLFSSAKLSDFKYLSEELSKFLGLEVDWNKRPQFGSSILWNVLSNNQLDTLQFIIDRGLDVNSRDFQFETELFIASDCGATDKVKILIQCKGIKVNISDQRGKSPLLIACQKGYLEIVKLLVECEEIDLDKLDDQSQTPLHVACKPTFTSRMLEIVKLLVEKGADLEKADRNFDD